MLRSCTLPTIGADPVTDLERLRADLIYCEEQLSIADSFPAKMQWGNRCDALESAILDILDGEDQ